MKKFFLKSIFIFLPILALELMLLFYLHPNSAISPSYLFTQIDKNKLLKNTVEPRIIFIGGSNLSFGLNSQMIKDSLHLNPINTGIHASIGLKYMLNNVQKFLRKNDIVVIAPEYQQFYGTIYEGETELLTILFDVIREYPPKIDMFQFWNLIKYVPSYNSYQVTKSFQHLDSLKTTPYDRKNYNIFGDECLHWKLNGMYVKPHSKIDGDINDDVINFLINFRKKANKLGVKLFISFPGYQEASYNNSVNQIKNVYNCLKVNEFKLLGTPERYRMRNEWMFDTPYHLIKSAVDYRTQLLIEDIRKELIVVN